MVALNLRSCKIEFHTTIIIPFNYLTYVNEDFWVIDQTIYRVGKKIFNLHWTWLNRNLLKCFQWFVFFLSQGSKYEWKYLMDYNKYVFPLQDASTKMLTTILCICRLVQTANIYYPTSKIYIPFLKSIFLTFRKRIFL